MSEWTLFGPLEPVRPEPEPRGPSPVLLEIHRRLCALFGCPVAYFHSLDPLSELVSSMLSHRTKNADSGAAFREVRRRFSSWELVRDAPTAEVQAAISRATWPELKAPRIQAVLRAVTEQHGEPLSLDFLATLPVPEARAWLEGLTGVGHKTSAAVLAFSSIRGRALPVDSHHHRVAVRRGVIPSTMPVGESHAGLEAMLPPEWDAQAVYDHHEVMMFLGQRVCHHARPDCPRCPLLDLCPEGQRRTRGAATPAAHPGEGPAAGADRPARSGAQESRPRERR